MYLQSLSNVGVLNKYSDRSAKIRQRQNAQKKAEKLPKNLGSCGSCILHNQSPSLHKQFPLMTPLLCMLPLRVLQGTTEALARPQTSSIQSRLSNHPEPRSTGQPGRPQSRHQQVLNPPARDEFARSRKTRFHTPAASYWRMRRRD